MVELLQTVIEFFRVQNFASTYSNPLDQFLYGIFFPSILLVILIYLLIQRIFPEHRGLAVLLGVSFYIFIIVYPPNAATSLYAAFAPIGAFWYLVVILIGIIYLFFNRILPSHRARDGGGGGGARGSTLPMGRGSKYSLKETFLGDVELDPRARRLIKDEIKVIDQKITRLKAEKATSVGGEREQYDKQIAILVDKKEELRLKLQVIKDEKKLAA